jgi:hypothetical protein
MPHKVQTLWSLATQIWELMLERSNETPSLVVALSSPAEQIEGHIDAAACNGVNWGA